MYDDALAEAYDDLYAVGLGKDYRHEARALSDLIRARNPHAHSLLDVGCGTGEHLRTLATLFDDVEGVEPSAPMRAHAQAKLPGATIHDGDMRDLRLGRSYDAVVCLFSTIGYAVTTDDLYATVASLTRHAARGAVVVIEPWFTPDQWIDGKISHLVAETGTRTVVRVSHSSRAGTASLMTMHYLVADSDAAEPIRHFSDEHTMGLHTDDDYHAAMAAAGLSDITRAEGWQPGRDRLIGIRA